MSEVEPSPSTFTLPSQPGEGEPLGAEGLLDPLGLAVGAGSAAERDCCAGVELPPVVRLTASAVTAPAATTPAATLIALPRDPPPVRLSSVIARRSPPPYGQPTGEPFAQYDDLDDRIGYRETAARDGN